MAITVTMIEEKEFKTKVRGYDPLEVDEFLDAICDEMESLNATIQQLRDQLKQQQSPIPYMPAISAPPPPLAPLAPPAPAAPAVPALPNDLKTAKLLLEKTQKACDETIAEANRRADEIIKQAEQSVPDPELEGLAEKKEQLKKELAALETDAQKFRQRFQTMLKDQIDILDSELS